MRTPGPWHYDATTKIVHTGSDVTAESIVEYTEANARLMAAAPELLAIADIFKDMLEAAKATETPLYTILCRTIAKADGKEKK